jgi:hypothetical protein
LRAVWWWRPEAVAVGEELAAVPEVQGVGDAAADRPEDRELAARRTRRRPMKESCSVM